MRWFRTPDIRVAGLLLALLLLGACAGTQDQQEPASHLALTGGDLAQLLPYTQPPGWTGKSDELLVVFDIDNTLLAMDSALGSNNWYEWQSEQGDIDACDPRVVADRLAVQGALYFMGSMSLVQDDAPALVRGLQQRGIAVMAVTARGPDFWLPTFRELRRNGLDFRATAPAGAGLPSDRFIPASGSRDALYQDGVLMLAGQDKGEVLAEILAMSGREWPRRLLVADDSGKNIDDFAAAAEARHGDLVSLLYEGEITHRTQYDPDQAHQHWLRVRDALRVLQEELAGRHFELPEGWTDPACETP